MHFNIAKFLFLFSFKRRRCSQHDVDFDLRGGKQALHCLETQQGINTPTDIQDIQKSFFSDFPFLTSWCLQHIQHLTR